MSVLSWVTPIRCRWLPDIEHAPVTTQGRRSSTIPFPNRVNAGYLQVRDRQRIALRVWERGAGETLACGTGASRRRFAASCAPARFPVRVEAAAAH